VERDVVAVTLTRMTARPQRSAIGDRGIGGIDQRLGGRDGGGHVAFDIHVPIYERLA
jgi:hypothetical protein